MNPTILELEIAVTATHAQAMAPGIRIITDNEIEYRCEMMTAHLKSCCEGLLKVHDPLDRNWEASNSHERKSEYRKATMRDRFRLDRKVLYLHRTVKDFLKTNAVRARLLEHTKNLLDFDLHISLLMYSVISMKWRMSFFCYGTGTGDNEPLWKITKDALQVARKSNKLSSPTSCGLFILREFYGTALFWWQHPMIVDAPEDVSRKLPSSLDATEFPSMARLSLAKEFREGFLELVRELGMSAYIDDIPGTEMTLPVQALLGDI